MSETAADIDSELGQRSRKTTSAGERAVANPEKALKEAREMIDQLPDTLGETSQEPNRNKGRQPR